MKNKAHEVIAKVLKRDGEIVPAFLAGERFEGRKCSTELGRRCRQLFQKGILSKIQSYPFSIFGTTAKTKKFIKEVLSK